MSRFVKEILEMVYTTGHLYSKQCRRLSCGQQKSILTFDHFALSVLKICPFYAIILKNLSFMVQM